MPISLRYRAGELNAENVNKQNEIPGFSRSFPITEKKNSHAEYSYTWNMNVRRATNIRLCGRNIVFKRHVMPAQTRYWNGYIITMIYYFVCILCSVKINKLLWASRELHDDDNGEYVFGFNLFFDVSTEISSEKYFSQFLYLSKTINLS